MKRVAAKTPQIATRPLELREVAGGNVGLGVLTGGADATQDKDGKTSSIDDWKM